LKRNISCNLIGIRFAAGTTTTVKAVRILKFLASRKKKKVREEKEKRRGFRGSSNFSY
jgi:hypothetical protein